MIGFNELGLKGWLGNQMFQYSGLKGIAGYNGYEYTIPPNDDSRHCNYLLFDVFKLTTLKNVGYINKPTYVHETSDDSCHTTSFHYSEKFMKECPDDVNISGFFQSEKFFKHVSDSIRKDFEFKTHIMDECIPFIQTFEVSPIFIHVRRSDYLRKTEHHKVLSIDYYANALKYFDDNTPVLIFSDDISWCEKQSLFSSDRFFISKTDERLPLNKWIRDQGYNSGTLIPYYDLCLMTLCSGAIIANSSLSWWGAWLQKDPTKKIIAPKDWFGPLNLHLITEDLFPDEWITI
jgi:hypothetical protein